MQVVGRQAAAEGSACTTAVRTRAFPGALGRRAANFAAGLQVLNTRRTSWPARIRLVTMRGPEEAGCNGGLRS